MPIYPFRCDACGVEFEVTRKASAATQPAACPACGGATRRIFTAVGRTGPSAKTASSGAPSAPKIGGGSVSHYGHQHASGAGGHSHGGAAGGPPLPSSP